MSLSPHIFWGRLASGLAAASFSLVPAAVEASFLDLYGFNPRAMGMACAHTAVADDFTALYYNPAGLTAAKHGVYGFGLLFSRPSLKIDLEREEPEIPGLEPANATAITFGGMFQLGGESVRDRVSMAFAISVPTRSLLNGQALDPAIPHWYLYHSLPERLVALLGIGVLPLDWLSLGFGVQILASLVGELDYELDFVAGRFSRKTVTFDIEPTAAALLGIEIRPIPGLRAGLGYRGSIATTVDLPVRLELTGIALLDVSTRFTVQYTPDEISFGASYFIDPISLLVTADATYSFWGNAPDPSVSSRLDIGGDLFDGAGLSDVLDAPAPGQERAVQLGLSNILTVRAGIERPIGDFTVRAGYAFRPSPTPVQTSGTNFIDGSAHHLAVGAGLAWKDPWGVLTNPVILDASAMLAILPSRRHEKVDASDPVGSYDASGRILALGLALRYAFEEGKMETPEVVPPVPSPQDPPAQPSTPGPSR